jgi:hypothetical protein
MKNNRYYVMQITRQDALDKLQNHPLKRAPQIMYAFGLFDRLRKKSMVAVVTFGSPASPTLCTGICGEDERLNVIELNRLWADSSVSNDVLIFFLREALRRVPKEIVVSFVQPERARISRIYKQLGFLYTGLTKKRTDRVSLNGEPKHNRHNSYDKLNTYVAPRPRKHRFVLFNTTGDRKKQLEKKLKYDVYSY